MHLSSLHSNLNSDEDYDCVEGLLCAQKHYPEIQAYGLDKRKVYCTETSTGGSNGGFLGPYEDLEVCYDPNKLKTYNKTKL
jgi:hypothetical protein